MFESSFSTSSSDRPKQGRRQRRQFPDQATPPALQFLLVGYRRLPAGRHDLRLVAFRQHHADVVPQRVERLARDEARCFQHVALGGGLS